MSVEIKLTHGFSAIVDDEDATYINQFNWHVRSVSQPYATRTVYPNGKKGLHKAILMHRVIANAPKGVCVDHINGNVLDNRKSNLRLCNSVQNSFNKNKLCSNNTSGFTGVTRVRGKKWQAQIGFNNTMIYIGRFDKFEDAVSARIATEQELFGEFAPRHR